MNMSELDTLMNEVRNLLDSCKSLDAELKAMHDGKEFLINEYHTNKRWFREEPGRVTIEDVIKTSFEFGWSSHKQFTYGTEK